MSDLPVPAPLREADYQAIEAAVMETEKGRWFLAEYARRNRNADTAQVLDAVAGLKRILKRERRPDADRIRLDIAEMKDAIERTKLEIAQIKLDGSEGSRFDRASNELDAIVEQTEAATGDILSAAEKIQEIAWTMREAGVEEAVCAEVETLTTTIYMACSFQDLTGQRTQKVVHVLRYLEHRIDSMISIWGMDESEVQKTSEAQPDHGPVLDTRPDAHLLNGPQLAGQGMDQNRVDDLMFDGPAAPAAVADEAPAAEIDFALVEGPAPADEDVAFEKVDATTADEPLAADDVDYDDVVWAPVEAEADTVEVAAPEETGSFAEKPEASEESADEDPEAVAAMARAAEAMEEAIGTLKDVAAAATGRRPEPAPASDDPFERMTKAERQAHFT
ncbi:protein phosphatase CheZ [Oharaeibacter diazotrophicus]|uniref:Chemotaxis phosphatase CheZ n=1 Tax=Oharaeibacter diazotrophicus TaxID=1920512 RepID=A0A4V3CWU1_9HYPH|nr:protein phosphatase CheZ [Oharaeibacter diazotrophicus]TDP87678.1 chemotaxis phosphatase CheZ [Oharaeibacter diazotrophicus]BBE74739.1 chemotaxis regulator CheZ [Pleomorphomonas sp. SM30]GLS77121.1 hypothetical protein GCM10007904_24580 [Oharaeibacter diazotrophicus]